MEGTLGEIRGFAPNFAPRNWAYCQGQLLPINQNQALFSILGTTYGGDGRTSFGLPDLRGRTIIGAGQEDGLSNRPLGQKTGAEYHTLSIAEMPSHTHTAITTTASGAGSVSGDLKLPVSTEEGDEDVATNNFLAVDAGGEKRYSTETTPGVYLGALSSNLSVDVTSMNVDVKLLDSGAQQSFSLMKPALVTNYIICLTGLFPSRS